jgi:hypothetical protein
MLACHNSKFGVIYGFEDGLEFVENLQSHPNTFIDKFNHQSNTFPIRIRYRDEHNNDSVAKYVCYYHGQLMISMGRPLQFSIE